MKHRPFRIAAALCTLLLPGLLLAEPTPESSAPLVLMYLDTPVFAGPHEHIVTAVAFSPDGKTLASGANDGRLRLWDTATGRLQSVYTDDAMRGISGVAFSPDGQLVAVIGGLLGPEAILWNLEAGRIERELDQPAAVGTTTSHGPPMLYKGRGIDLRSSTAVAFSPDGRLLAVAGDGVDLWDVRSGEIAATIDEPVGGVTGISFAPDGGTLAAAGKDGKVRLWSVPGATVKATLGGASQPLTAVAVSPDGARIVAASAAGGLFGAAHAGVLWVWDHDESAPSGRRPAGRPRRIDIPGGIVRRVAFAGPGTVLVAAGPKVISVDVTGTAAGREGLAAPREIRAHSDEVLALSVSPDGELAASGSADRTVDIFNPGSGALAHRLPGLPVIYSSVAVSDDGKLFATATIDVRFSYRPATRAMSLAARQALYFSGEANAGRMVAGDVRLWSTADGRMVSLLSQPPTEVTAITFVPRSSLIAVAGWVPGRGGSLLLWDREADREVRAFAAGAAEVLCAASAPDGTWLASGDIDGNLAVWDTRTGGKIWSFRSPAPVAAVTISADGKVVAGADRGKTVRLFDAVGGKVVRTMRSRSPVASLAFSPDGQLLAAGTRTPGIELWDLPAGTASRTLKAPGDYFDAMPGFVAFSPDGRYIAGGGHGKDIALFDAHSGTLFGELRGHAHAPTGAAFLPDGRLVSTGEEGTIRLWDVNVNHSLATWIAVPADPGQGWDDEWVGFTPTGEFVGSRNLDRLVGWVLDGDYSAGREGDRMRQVESLFPPR